MGRGLVQGLLPAPDSSSDLVICLAHEEVLAFSRILPFFGRKKKAIDLEHSSLKYWIYRRTCIVAHRSSPQMARTEKAICAKTTAHRVPDTREHALSSRSPLYHSLFALHHYRFICSTLRMLFTSKRKRAYETNCFHSSNSILCTSRSALFFLALLGQSFISLLF